MSIQRALIALSLSLGLAACASAPSIGGDAAAVIQSSGTASLLARLETPLPVEKMEGPLALIPDEWIALVNSTVAENLKPQLIRDDLQSRLQNTLTAKELTIVQRFYESPVGQRVVRIESGKESNTNVVIGNETLDALVKASGIGQSASLLAQHGLNDAIDVAVKNGCFGLNEIPMAKVLVGVVKKAQLNALRSSVNTGIRQQYAALTESERMEYLVFAQSTAGKKFLTQRAEAINAAAVRVGNSLSAQLGEKIQGSCSKKRS